MPRLDIDTGLKTCSKCKIPKDPECFYRDSHAPDGLRNWCTPCSNQARHAYYRTSREANPERWRQGYSAQRERFQENNPSRYILSGGTRRHALKTGIPFTITEEDIRVPDNCPIPSCGRKLLFGRESGMLSSPSLDKFDPSLGYIPGNVWIICNGCNIRKQDMSGEDHILFGQELVEAFKNHQA